MPSPFGVLQRVLNSRGVPFQTERAPEAHLADAVAELRLPSRVVDLYREYGPAPNSSIPWVVEDLRLFSVTELAAAQEGYAWVQPARTPSSVWPPHRVVIASMFGDPFVANTSEAAVPVELARHGAGTWAPQQVAPSVDAFVLALASLESVLLGDFDRDVWDEQGLRPAFILAVERRLAEMLPPLDLANLVHALD